MSVEGNSIPSAHLIRIKAGYLSEVRRREKVVKEALCQEVDKVILDNYFGEYEVAFKNYMSAHEEYLEGERDEQKKSQAIQVYQTEQDKRLNLQISVAKVTKSVDQLSEGRSRSARSSVSSRSSLKERKRVITARLKLKALEEKHDLLRKEAQIKERLELLEARVDAEVAEECLLVEEQELNVESEGLINEVSGVNRNIMSPVSLGLDRDQVSFNMSHTLPTQQVTENINTCPETLYSTSLPIHTSILPSTSFSHSAFSSVSMPRSSHVSRPYYSHNQPHVTETYTLSGLPSTCVAQVSNHYQPSPHSGGIQHNVGWSAPNSRSYTPAIPAPYITDTSQVVAPWIAIADAIQQGHALPKIELLKFGGDPKEYVEFITNFKLNIESKVQDPLQRLTRLLAQCTGKAREAIRSCINLPPDQGYMQALQTLHENFGLPHMVCEAQMTRLREIRIKSADSATLMGFARILEDTWRVLDSMGPRYSSRLNNEEVIKMLMKKLPGDGLKEKWAQRAGDLILKHGDAHFVDFVDFIKRLGARLNNSYGEELKSRQPRDLPHKGKPTENVRITTLANQAKKYPPCLQCKGSHGIWKCFQFKRLNHNERIAQVQRLKLCRLCLGGGHFAKDCKSGFHCKVRDCNENHHALIHPPDTRSNHASHEATLITSNVQDSRDIIHSTTQTEEDISVGAVRASTPKICFKVIPVRVQSPNGGKVIETNAFLDSGSDKTLCLKHLIDRLQLPSKAISYDMSTTSSKKKVQGQKTTFRIGPLKGRNWYTLEDVWTTESIPVTRSHFASTYDLEKWPHLQDVELSDISTKEVTILIGNDYPGLVERQLSFREGNPGDPVAIETPLGWTVCGPVGDTVTPNKEDVVTLMQSSSNEEIRKDFERMYNNDFLGTISDEIQGSSEEDKKAVAIMENTIKLSDGHFQVGLPFYNRNVQLPDSLPVARSRLLSLKKRFTKDPVFKEKYCNVMKQYLEEGSARKATEQELEFLHPRWYLPHHAVWHPRKPEAPRVVFDCAAKSQGISLNDCLLKGPENTSSLIGVLMRFRLDKIGVAADIKRMYHQVFVPPEDRGALCYLWWPNGDLSKDPVTHVMKVHIFGATSSASVCGFALRKVADIAQSVSEKTLEAIRSSFYVDDLLQSFENENDAIETMKELRMLLKTAGFTLTKFTSSSREVLESIPSEDRSQACKDLQLQEDDLPSERALGVRWNVQEDCFKLTLGEKKQTATRRGILSSIASVYDPLGVASPLILPGRQLNQELCRLNYGWDEPLPHHIIKSWNEWKDGLASLSSFSIPRCVKPVDWSSIHHIELHHFSDASEHHGYGTVSYLRFSSPENDHFVSFVFGKSRVKPLRSGITVPKLELTAASVLVSVNNMLLKELDGKIKIDDVIFWTDSVIVLRYLRNEKRRFSQFVANRVAKIKESTEVHQWRHVRSENNPADLASRGVKADDEDSLKFWTNGPEFLWKDKENWPVQPQEIAEELSEEDEGVRKEKVILTSTVIEENLWSEIFQKYSNWSKLRRVVGWVLRAVKRFKKVEVSTEPYLSVEELLDSERSIVRGMQEIAFGEARFTDLKKGKSSWARLQPIVEEGIIRVGGRLNRSTLPYDFKHPMIIPSNHDVTRLLILHFHSRSGHSGAQHVLSELRKKFWVIRGLAGVKKVLRKCHECKRQFARAGEQITAPLPLIRVSSDSHGLIQPFSAVGIDLFGPLMTIKGRMTRSSKNAAKNKRYGCIFTCLRYRAIHLEMLNDLTTDSFINGIIRFVARRGPPRVIISDNGSNFKGAEKDVLHALQSWNQDKIANVLAENSIRWEFNPPGASHQGGVWERLIRSVRHILHSLLRESLVDDETLRTFLCEAEKIMNDRPITKLSDDPRDESALTPSDILLLRSNTSCPPYDIKEEEKYKARWKYINLLANRFWQRWVAEYLPTLQERQKWLRHKSNLKSGDLVLIIDKGLPRGQWSKGVIEETYPDSDGNVRRVYIRTANGYYTRDIRKVCLLEENIIQKFEELD